MSNFPFPFYSSTAIVSKYEEKARKEIMTTIVERYKDKVSALPKNKTWLNFDVCKYQGFWFYQGFWLHSKASLSVEATMALQDDFKALPSDVFLASHAKSGTTWLKSLSFAILNRSKFKISTSSCQSHPLLTVNPHDCVPFIELESFLNNPSYVNGLMATHIPYTSLPESIISSGCRIAYICRNPKDVLISMWHFMNKLKKDSPTNLEDVFSLFTKGLIPNGSFWDHVIGYYKASLERPDKVYFLTYEELKKDTKNGVKKLAEFLGYPFTKEEEVDGSMEALINLCSFEKLSESNKGNKDDGDEKSKVPTNDIFFRKGIIGDSVNYLTTEMIEILDKISKEKFAGLNISY